MENKLLFFTLMMPMVIVIFWTIIDQISRWQGEPLQQKHVGDVFIIAAMAWWAFYFI